MKGEYDSMVLPCSSLKLGAVDVSDINKTELQQQNNIIFYTMECYNKKTENFPHGFRLFDAPKLFNLKDPEFDYNLQGLGGEGKPNMHFKLKLSVKNIALYVIIDSDLFDFIASVNFFSMEPNETRIIDIEILKTPNLSTNTSQQKNIDSFKILSLFDIIK